MGSNFGKNLKLSIFGESHGVGVGMVLDGFPPGMTVDHGKVRVDLDRRKPGMEAWSTPRKESDIPQVLGGIYNGRTTGAPIAIFFENMDRKSEDYISSELHYRPSHADFTGMIRYSGFNDFRGGGHFSGRLTTGMVYAGSLAKQLLCQKGITIDGHLSQVGTVKDISLEMALLNKGCLQIDFPMFSEQSALAAKLEIEKARTALDSVGAEITISAQGMPAGIGNPIFENIESHVASALFAIPGVKGISFGSGFDFAKLRGSEANDCFYENEGAVRTKTNHNGGINGGISNGMPIIVHVAIKPTPSIGIAQETLKENGEMEPLIIKGRHDPCIAPRALPVIESMFALALLDLYMDVYQVKDIK